MHAIKKHNIALYIDNMTIEMVESPHTYSHFFCFHAFFFLFSLVFPNFNSEFEQPTTTEIQIKNRIKWLRLSLNFKMKMIELLSVRFLDK